MGAVLKSRCLSCGQPAPPRELLDPAHRYRVSATLPDGNYATTVRAENPERALVKVIRRLGLEQVPSGPMLLAVWPVVQGHG